MDEEQDFGVCVWCHKPGAPYQENPYEAEINGRHVIEPIHDGDCYQELVWEI